MIAKFFAPGGALAKAIPGFQARQPQIEMATAVANAIKQQGQLVVEAGTGTGKTFAYLISALVSGKKTIISTGSKSLQEQLFHRDLPLMTEAIGFTGPVALLKGRANYLCLDRLARQTVESHGVHTNPTQLTQLVKIRSWSSASKTGTWASVTNWLKIALLFRLLLPPMIIVWDESVLIMMTAL